MEVSFAVVSIMMALMPVVVIGSVYGALKILKIDKPSFGVWLLTIIAGSMVANIIIQGAVFLTPEFPLSLVAIIAALIITAVIALFFHKFYGVEWRKTVTVIIAIYAAAVLIGNGGMYLAQHGLLRQVAIEDNGMAPQIKMGDRVAFQRYNNDYKRGSLVSYQNVYDKKTYVRRVAGLPGETIEIKEGKVLINGQETQVVDGGKIYVDGVETDLPAEHINPQLNHTPVTLANDEYFVICDAPAQIAAPCAIGPINTTGDAYVQGIAKAIVQGNSIFSKDGIGYLPLK